MWFMTSNIPVEEEKHAEVDNQPKIKESIPIKVLPKRNPIPLFIVDACSVLDIFTKAPFVYKRKKVTNRKKRAMDSDTNNSISTIGVTIFLVLLVINAAFDVLKEKEKRKKKISTEGRRQSLAEFANKKPLRRESSKFGFQLFQIAETDKSESDEKASRRRPYTRGESINSYLSDKKPQTETAPPSIGDPNLERKLVKRQSIAKLFGMYFILHLRFHFVCKFDAVFKKETFIYFCIYFECTRLNIIYLYI